MDKEWNRFLLYMSPLILVDLALTHLMISRVNRQLSEEERVPHIFFWGQWRFVKREYRRLYPTSHLDRVENVFSVVVLFFVLAYGLWNFWPIGNGLLAAVWLILSAFSFWFFYEKIAR